MIVLNRITKQYQIANNTVSVLKNLDLSIERGEFLAIMGPSGSGKSTLLHILGCLDRPNSGKYYLEGEDIFQASDKDLSKFRANHIGFVFQNFNLIPVLNVFENVELPFLYSNLGNSPELYNKFYKKDRIIEVIQKVGLSNRLKHKPSELSGGEMQRVAIARAMVMNPKIILADEPTGNLDSKTGEDILQLFKNFNKSGGTVIMITHDFQVASHAEKCLHIKDGEIVN